MAPKDILVSSSFISQNYVIRQTAEIENHLMRECLSFSTPSFLINFNMPRCAFVYFHKEKAFYSTASHHEALFQPPRMYLWKTALSPHHLKAGTSFQWLSTWLEMPTYEDLKLNVSKEKDFGWKDTKNPVLIWKK